MTSLIWLLRASTACKAQVHLFLIIIASQQARVDKQSIKTLFAFIVIG